MGRPPPPGRPLKVYNGAIKHVLYIIKENRTYDEVLWRPAHRQRRPQALLARRDGHAQPPQDRPRVHPLRQRLRQRDQLRRRPRLVDPGDGQRVPRTLLRRLLADLPVRGGRPDVHLQRRGASGTPPSPRRRPSASGASSATRTRPSSTPIPRTGSRSGRTGIKGTNRFKFKAVTDVPSLRPYINPEVHYWPLLQSDQFRADVFIREYEGFSKADTVPDLMILSLPCDHGEGTSPKYPTPSGHDGRQRPGARPGGRGDLQEPAVERTPASSSSRTTLRPAPITSTATGPSSWRSAPTPRGSTSTRRSTRRPG